MARVICSIEQLIAIREDHSEFTGSFFFHDPRIIGKSGNVGINVVARI